MRKSNWKSKLLMFVAIVVGVLAGVGGALYVNTVYPAATGLAFFGGMGAVAALIIFIGARVFRIGRE